jgi:hypothetical protein
MILRNCKTDTAAKAHPATVAGVETTPDDGLIRITILGILPTDHDEIVCSTCEIIPLVAYIGYSFASTVISVDRAGYCDTCDTMILPGDGFEV